MWTCIFVFSSTEKDIWEVLREVSLELFNAEEHLEHWEDLNTYIYRSF